MTRNRVQQVLCYHRTSIANKLRIYTYYDLFYNNLVLSF
jgi:hypothetical protein